MPRGGIDDDESSADENKVINEVGSFLISRAVLTL